MDKPASTGSAADKLRALHKSRPGGMPSGPEQEIRVMYAALDPGDRTPRHFHRHPVTVYVQEGEFTLELDGQAPIVIHEGEVFIEPPQVRMVGYNASDSRTVTVLFYVSEPDAPFAEIAT
jgi:quercetin dioxygenase-like cupin family protein